MIDDPDDLIGEQSGINGVIDGADAQNPVPALEVPPRVPSQGRHPVAKAHAVALKPLRDAQSAPADLGVIGRMHWPFDGSRDHGSLAGIGRGVIDDAMAQQRPVLHQALHALPPFAARAPGKTLGSDRALDRGRPEGDYGRNSCKI